MNITFNDNYKNKIFNINFINDKKFIIFKIPNFLDKHNYDYLNKNFPKIDEERLKNFEIIKNNYKYLISSKDSEYEKTIKENICLKQLHDEIFSENFFNYFFNNLKKYFYFSRLTDPKFFLKLIKPKKLEQTNSSFFFTRLKRQIEYSYIFNGGKIVPHTDSRYKLLSLMLYFPEFEENNKFFSKERDTGTVFWDSNKKNLDNLHLSQSIQEKIFKKENKVLIKLPFEKFNLYGFIRNQYSWHSVEKIHINKKYIRRSININFYF